MDRSRDSPLRRSLLGWKQLRRSVAENRSEDEEHTEGGLLHAGNHDAAQNTMGALPESSAVPTVAPAPYLNPSDPAAPSASSTTPRKSGKLQRYDPVLESFLDMYRQSADASRGQQNSSPRGTSYPDCEADALEYYLHMLQPGTIQHRLIAQYRNWKRFHFEFDPVAALAELGLTIHGDETFRKLRYDTPADEVAKYLYGLAESVVSKRMGGPSQTRLDPFSTDDDEEEEEEDFPVLLGDGDDLMTFEENALDQVTTSDQQPPDLIHPHQIIFPSTGRLKIKPKSEPRARGSHFGPSDNTSGALAQLLSQFQRKRRRTSSPPEQSDADALIPTDGGNDTARTSSQMSDLLASLGQGTDSRAPTTLIQRMFADPQLQARLLPFLSDGALLGDVLVAPSLTSEQIEHHVREFVRIGKTYPKVEVKGIMPPKQAYKTRMKEMLWLSELFPKKFSRQKRADLLQIFREKVSYVPSAICGRIDTRLPITYYVQTKPRAKASTRRFHDLPLGVGKRGWPAAQIPTEIFEHITDFLPRESLQTMRLVNSEFESKVSNRLFHTVVVPFREEIYGFLQQSATEPSLRQTKNKGKGKAKAVAEAEPTPEEKRLHDGMKVFEAWGRNIQRFALAFEVDEAALENAPKKGRFEQHETYWGDYKWPHAFYFRYESIETLEKKADEFRCMSQALSYLVKVSELGLCLDSGLGWLTGPDKSDRARMLQQKSEVFGRAHKVPDCKQTEQQELWDDLSESAALSKEDLDVYLSDRDSLDVLVELGNVSLKSPELPGPRRRIPLTHRQRKKVVVLEQRRARENHRIIFEGKEIARATTTPNSNAVRSIRDSSKASSNHYNGIALKPNALTEAQLEWLLETDWAQRAFLSSFCMALSDNASTFSNVHTLNISKISSRYLRSLQRDDVWQGLRTVNTLTIRVSPDWRDIIKTDAGLVCSPRIKPSEAVGHFFAFLSETIRKLRHIKTLTLSYVGGGEHQPGIFGRNKFVLPAPLCAYSTADSPVNAAVQIAFPYVKTLTLENMWLTPYQLCSFAARHTNTALRHFTLSSVSLTASADSNRSNALTADADAQAYDIAQGPPRRTDPLCAEYLQNHRAFDTPDPSADGWITKGVRKGSWAEVLDAITPSATISFLRWVFNYRDDPPSLNLTNLETLTLHSCGYIHLDQLESFAQAPLASLSNQHTLIPAAFARRAADLNAVMMVEEEDVMVGSIVSAIPGEESEVLRTGPVKMVVGRESWGGVSAGGGGGGGGGGGIGGGAAGGGLRDWRQEAWFCVEDGQPWGGEGRISGVLHRLEGPGRAS